MISIAPRSGTWQAFHCQVISLPEKSPCSCRGLDWLLEVLLLRPGHLHQQVDGAARAALLVVAPEDDLLVSQGAPRFLPPRQEALRGNQQACLSNDPEILLRGGRQSPSGQTQYFDMERVHQTHPFNHVSWFSRPPFKMPKLAENPLHPPRSNLAKPGFFLIRRPRASLTKGKRPGRAATAPRMEAVCRAEHRNYCKDRCRNLSLARNQGRERIDSTRRAASERRCGTESRAVEKRTSRARSS